MKTLFAIFGMLHLALLSTACGCSGPIRPLNTEPALIQLVDLAGKALRPVLTEEQLDTLQRLLEGRRTVR